MTLSQSLLLASLCASITGCTVGPDYQRPEAVVPPRYGEVAATQPTTQSVTQGVAPVVEWWGTFNDPQLKSLIERAAASNLDLRIATARVREARALRGVAAADRLPNVNANAAYQRSQRSQNLNQFGDFEFPSAPGVSPDSFDPKFGEEDLWQGGFDASWELDVFGRVRRSVEAADAEVAAAVEGRRDVLVTLLSEVARNYVELRGLQRQLEIAQANIESQRQSMELANVRFRTGLTGELDVIRARAQVAATTSQVPAIEELIGQTVHRLGVLLGREPRALSAELADHKAIPVGPPEVPLGLPSDLLRRRADIQRAERQLAAATARIGEATADLFPRFSLTGSFGLQSDRLGNIGSWDSRFWNVGPAVSWPVFDGGRIRANVGVQDARQEQALAAYEQSVLVALEDVENALVSYARQQQRRQSLMEAVEANRRAVALAEELYTRGLADFLNVLEAQRSLYLAQDALVQSDRAVSVALVRLYKALGGGWEGMEAPPTEPPTEPPSGNR